MRIMCSYCGKNGRSYSNGLCIKCNTIPEARKKFPHPNIGKKYPAHKEPTLAELDALIAERMKPENLPDWWEKERAKS